jgi:hypothetical protein
MKDGNPGKNGSNLDKGNIFKPTFDTLMEEGRKAFNAYCVNLEELFPSHCEVTWHGTVLKDTMSIIFNKPKVQPNPLPSLNDVQAMTSSALECQAKSADELLRRLIEEWDRKKHYVTSANLSSSICVVSFTQTNPHTSGPLAGDTLIPNPSAQPVNHFHNQTTIEGSAHTFEMPHQTANNMFGQGYTYTSPSFTIPNPGSASYTSGYNGQAYPNPNGNYRALYTNVAYTNPIPLPGSSLGFLPNHTYQNTPHFNAYD